MDPDLLDAINWPVGSGCRSVILNFGSGFLLLIKEIKKCQKKFYIHTVTFNDLQYSTTVPTRQHIFLNDHKNGHKKIRSAGSGSVIQDYRSADPDPKEIVLQTTTLSSGIVRNPSISSVSFSVLWPQEPD